jgi:ketosteroid isomerase-like protein
MRRQISIPVLVLMTGLILSAAVQDEVAQAEKAWATAVVKGDHATLDKLLADGLIYTHSSGLVEDKAAYFGSLTSGKLKYETLNEEGVTVKAYGDAAIVHARIKMNGINNGAAFNVSAVLTHVWVKQGGSWKLAAHQATRLP